MRSSNKPGIHGRAGAALGQYLEPGEEVAARALCQSDADLGAEESFRGQSGEAVEAARVLGVLLRWLLIKRMYVVVTDRRLLLLRLNRFTKRHKRLVLQQPRAEVAIESTGRVKRHFYVALRAPREIVKSTPVWLNALPEKDDVAHARVVVFFHRVWEEEMGAIVRSIGPDRDS